MSRHVTDDFDANEGQGQSREDQLALARAKIRTKTIRCEVCGTRRQVTGHGRFCSDLCRSRAYRATRKAQSTLSAVEILAQIEVALDTGKVPEARRLCRILSTNLSDTQ